MPAVLVSACLLGIHSRYDGRTCPDHELITRLRRQGHPIVPVCPEQLGGLPTPRPPAQISAGDGHNVLEGSARVVTVHGDDVTGHYQRGARECVHLATLLGCTRAYLKETSPACGVRTIQRGGQTCPGSGVAAAALHAAGIQVIGVESLTGDE